MTSKEKQHLTPHFILYEFTRSGTALQHNLPNTPTAAQVSSLTSLCENVLEPLRQHFGPIVISSGFRSAAVNKLVGGSSTSQHMRGEAADLVLGDEERGMRMYEYIRDHLPFDQLILEPMGAVHPRWIHVSYTTRHAPRRMVL